MEFFSASKKVILDWYKQFICRRGPWCTFESRQATWFSMTKQQSGHASKTKTALSAQCWDPSPRYETLELAWTDSSPEMRVNNLWMAGQGSHSGHLLSIIPAWLLSHRLHQSQSVTWGPQPITGRYDCQALYCVHSARSVRATVSCVRNAGPAGALGSESEHKATLGIFLLDSARVSKAMSGRVSAGSKGFWFKDRLPWPRPGCWLLTSWHFDSRAGSQTILLRHPGSDKITHICQERLLTNCVEAISKLSVQK